jgi:hypothetical protein
MASASDQMKNSPKISANSGSISELTPRFIGRSGPAP